VGSSTHPGSGIPLVLMSAKLTTERILKEMCN
jgi:phytoene dehydrogenase-like protein